MRTRPSLPLAYLCWFSVRKAGLEPRRGDVITDRQRWVAGRENTAHDPVGRGICLMNIHLLIPQCSNEITLTCFFIKPSPRYLGPLVAVADLPGWRALRSASTSRLVIPPIKLSTVDSRAFPVAAAQVWNGLPEAVISSSSLQSFQRQLKTHLFQLSYPHLILWLLVWHRYSGPCSNVVI